MPYDVKGKTAIITGAGSGINYAFARELLEKGCNVLIADLSMRPEAESYYAKFTTSPKAVFQKTDVTSWKALDEMFAAAFKEFGQVDIICPGAGLFEPPFSNFWFPPGSKESRDKPDADRYLTMDVNVTHVIRMTQLAISHWLNPPKGQEKVSPTNPKRATLICSTAGQLAGLMYPLYFASKWAVNAFSRSLAQLEEIGIKVVAVSPGGVASPMLKEDPHKARTIDFDKDNIMTPEHIASEMYRITVDDAVKGGANVEVLAGGSREVPLFNNPGPQSGNSTTHWDVNLKEVWSQLETPGWGQPSKL